MLQWPVINNDLSSHHFHANNIGIFITSHSSGTQTVSGELVVTIQEKQFKYSYMDILEILA